MQTTPQNIDLILPYGETLRGLMEQPYISPADLKHTLRARGVFLRQNEKRDTIPVLTCCLLGPEEFDQLRERQENREDNPKASTQTLAWKSEKSLLEAIPPTLDFAALVFGEGVNYKVLGTPSFAPVGNDVNNICCEFEIEREDLSKSWAATRNTFRGKLRIEKAKSGCGINFVLTNTAEETKDLNRRFVKKLTQHFKEFGCVERDSVIETIRFSSFDNEQRVAFFRSMTREVESIGLEFLEVTDCGVCPDGKVKLPREVKWMEGHVNGLNINGIALQETVFMNEEYKVQHRLFLFYGMEAKYRFENPTARGVCSIVVEFPDFIPKKEGRTELEINISTLSLDSGHPPVNRIAVKEELLRRMNDFKLACFEQYRKKSAALVTELAASPQPFQLEMLTESV